MKCRIIIDPHREEEVIVYAHERSALVQQIAQLATVTDFTLTGGQVLLAIVSTYLLAFVQAGASVFNTIDHWPLAKSLLCHFATLYAAYTLCYLGNTWIPFEPTVLLIFTAIFVGGYFLVWGIVWLCVKTASKKMNKQLN